MKTSTLVLVAVAILAFSADPELPWRAGTSPRIAVLKKHVEAGDSQAIVRFWDEMKTRGTPLVEPLAGDPGHVLLTFLYRATEPAKAITLSAQLTTSRTDPLVLSRLLGTDVWYRTYWVRSDIRLSYSLAAPDSGKDPLNPKSQPAGIGLGPSYVELPSAPPQPWI